MATLWISQKIYIGLQTKCVVTKRQRSQVLRLLTKKGIVLNLDIRPLPLNIRRSSLSRV